MALRVFLMLATWRETQHLRAQSARARNPSKCALITTGATREEARILCKEV